MDSLTALLDDWVRGDAGAFERLVPVVYPALRTQARAFLNRGARSVTLQTTAVVNDLFIKLLTSPPKRLENQRHFFALAARLMRMALVDHYRERSTEKRGGRARRVPLHDDLVWVDAASDEMLAFDRAMAELEQLDSEQADLFGMRFVLGCTAEETAELTGLSKATVDRRVKLARAWLFARLQT